MSVRIADAAIVFSGITTPLARAAADARAHIAGVEKASMAVGRGGTGYAASVKDQNKALADQKRHLADNNKHREGGLLGTAAKGVVAGATFGLGLAGMGGLSSLADGVKDSIQLASNFEQMKISFEVMLGGADKADAMLGSIKDFAAQSPLTFDSAATAVKQLVAYGVAADQAMPTLRALTDVASGTGVEMGRLTLAYGQVATAGRLYGTELRQFTEAGVPIIDALATAMGKPKEAIKNLVEEGKVGFPQVVQAFKVMTENGGKFAGMTDKYAGSFAGQMERLQDSVQTLKREVGTAIIDEMGLKDAAQDVSAFTDRVRGGVGSLRPLLRGVGDVGKASAQLANEGGKVALIFGQVRLEKLSGNIPSLKELPGQLQTVLDDLKNFKIDPVSVGDAAVTMAEGALDAFSLIEDALGGLLKDGVDFKTTLLDGAQAIRKTADVVLGIFQQIKAMKDAVRDAKNVALDPAPALQDLHTQMAGPKPAFDLGRTQSPERAAALAALPAYVEPPRQAALPDDFATRQLKELMPNRMGVPLQDVGHGRATPIRLGIPAPVAPPRVVSPDEAKLIDFDRGAGGVLGAWSPEMRGATPKMNAAILAPSAPPAKPPTLRESIKTRMTDLKANIEKERSERNTQRVMDATTTKFEAMGAVMGGAFGGVGLAAKNTAAELYKLKVPDQIPARFMELADKLKKEVAPKLDPLGELAKHVADLDFMQSKNLISPDVKAMGVQEAFANAVKGMDLSYKPPPSAEFGSKEFAKLETSAFTSSRNESVADLLKQIKQVADDELRQAKRTEAVLIEMLRAQGVVVKVPEN